MSLVRARPRSISLPPFARTAARRFLVNSVSRAAPYVRQLGNQIYGYYRGRSRSIDYAGTRSVSFDSKADRSVSMASRKRYAAAPTPTGGTAFSASGTYNSGADGGYKRGSLSRGSFRKSKHRKRGFKLGRKMRKAIKKISKASVKTNREIYMRSLGSFMFSSVTCLACPQQNPPIAMASDCIGWRAVDFISPVVLNNQIHASTGTTIAALRAAFFSGTDSGYVIQTDAGAFDDVPVNFTTDAGVKASMLQQRSWLFDIKLKLFMKNNTAGGQRLDVYLVRNTESDHAVDPCTELATLFATSYGIRSNPPSATEDIWEIPNQFWDIKDPQRGNGLDKNRLWKCEKKLTVNLNSGDEVSEFFRVKFWFTGSDDDDTAYPKGYPMLVFRIEGDISHRDDVAAAQQFIMYAPAQCDMALHRDMTIYETRSTKYVHVNRIENRVSQNYVTRAGGTGSVKDVTE